MQLSWRKKSLLGAIVGILLLAVALFFQFNMQLEPCPLCILQRIVIVFLTLILFMAAIHNPGSVGRRVYALIVLLVALCGVAIAGWHVWLQHFPLTESMGCAPGLNYMVMNLPWSTTFKMLFYGSADCSVVSWTFLGISMSGWTLVIFIVYSVMALWNYRSR